MKETVMTCDKCHKRVPWLYDIPRLVLEGSVINEYPTQYELCKECALKLIDMFNDFDKTKE